MNSDQQPVCLSIAGLDPSGGAGIIADIKTFRAFGCFGVAAVTSLTFQNTEGVYGSQDISAEVVRNQVQPVIDDFNIAAVKTGMLPSQSVVEEVARLVGENGLTNFVVDPVVRSTSGYDLIDDDALRSLTKTLFPLSILVTPNIPEAERITRISIAAEADFERAAKIMQLMGAANVLIKGGHFSEVGNSEGKVQGRERKAKDYLFAGDEREIFEAGFIETTATHGTGCTLSAAIAANLALGSELSDAIEISKRFVLGGIRNAPHLGHGNSPILI